MDEILAYLNNKIVNLNKNFNKVIASLALVFFFSVITIAFVTITAHKGADGGPQVAGVAASGQCIADINGDGQVNGSDLNQLLGNWGSCRGGGNCTADLDANGTIDGWDLALLLGDWGDCPGNEEPEGELNASFTAQPQQGNPPLNVTFNASASETPSGTSITGYGWTFGDGTTGTGQQTTHTYTNSGSYTATLTVTNSTGETDSSSKTIQVQEGSQPTSTCDRDGSERYCDDFVQNITSNPDVNQSSIQNVSWDNNTNYVSGAGQSGGTPIPTNGLVSWWKLNESSGSSFSDSAGNNSASCSGNQCPQVGVSGNQGSGARFDGNDDRLNAGSFNVSGNDMTISAWVKVDSYNSNIDPRIIAKTNSTAEQDHYWMLGLTSSGNIRARLKTDSTATIIATGNPVPVGQWTHVAFVYNGSSMILYRNGQQVSSASKNGNIATNSGIPVAIGNNPNGSGAINGTVDEVAVWDRALSASEIQAIAQGSVGASASFESKSIDAGDDFYEFRADWQGGPGLSMQVSMDGGAWQNITNGQTITNDSGFGDAFKYRVNYPGANISLNKVEFNWDTEEPVIPVPEAPSNMIAVALSSSQVSLTWTDNSNNETGFTLQRSKNSNFNNIDATTPLPAGSVSHLATGLDANTTYYFRVRALNSSGNSPFSNTSSATTFQQQQEEDPPVGENVPLGMNLDVIDYGSPMILFANLMKQSDTRWRHPSTWIPLENLPLDSQGYPLSVTPGNDVLLPIIKDFTSPGFTASPAYPTGTYTISFEGAGKVRIGGDVNTPDIVGTGGVTTSTFTVNNPTNEGLHLRIVESQSGNNIRNVKILLPGVSAAQEASNPWNPQFLNMANDFSVLRYMDTLRTNNSDVISWSDRTPVNYRTQARGISPEMIVELSNKSGTNPWITIPHKADDSYIQGLANLLKNNLNPDLRAYIEYSNEMWNSGFSQHAWAGQQGQNAGLNGGNTYGNAIRWQGHRMAQISCQFQDVFGSDLDDRIVLVVGGQADNWWATGQSLYQFANTVNNTAGCDVHADAAAIAPYFARLVTSNTNPQGILDSIHPENDLDFNTITRVQENLNELNNFANSYYPVKLISYEGGQHILPQSGSQTNAVAAANRLPDMGDDYRTMFENWYNTAGDDALFVHYMLVGKSGGWGAWGALEYTTQTNSAKYQAIKDQLAEFGSVQGASTSRDNESENDNTLAAVGSSDSGDITPQKGAGLGILFLAMVGIVAIVFLAKEKKRKKS